ncbi:MAG TPA: hypothetical protein PLJ84_00980 [Bacteroidales bacterium]|nr:hypothetical protein [Bacteroidales bacterium]
MKKIIPIFMMLLMCSMTSTAQVEKGKWFAAGYGTVNFDFGKEKYKSGGTTSESHKYFELDLNPLIGYFVIDKLPVGLYFDSYFHHYKYAYNDDKEKESQFIAGPFVRYYILEMDKFFPFVEGRLGLGLWRSKYDDNDAEKYSFISPQLGIGTSYFFTDHVALDAYLGYSHQAWTDKSEHETGVKSVLADDEYKEMYGAFVFRVGVDITFGKE